MTADSLSAFIKRELVLLRTQTHGGIAVSEVGAGKVCAADLSIGEWQVISGASGTEPVAERVGGCWSLLNLDLIQWEN